MNKNNLKILTLVSIIFLFIGVSIYLFSNSINQSNCKYAYVEKVYDGDTIYTKSLGKIRLLGIDTPEIYHPGFTKVKDYKFYGCGEESKKFTEKYLLHKKIKFCYDKFAKEKGGYGRNLMYAMISSGNKEITFGYLSILNGWAFVYKYGDFSKKKEYEKAEQIAKNKKLGIWSEYCQKQDVEFKIKMGVLKNLPKCYIKGNISSKGKKIYYLPSDPNYNKVKINPEKGEKWFCSEEEAIKEGFQRIK